MMSAILDQVSMLPIVFGFYGPILAVVFGIIAVLKRKTLYTDLMGLSLGLGLGAWWFPVALRWLAQYQSVVIFDYSMELWVSSIVGLMIGAALGAAIARLGRRERFTTILLITVGFGFFMVAMVVYVMRSLAAVYS